MVIVENYESVEFAETALVGALLIGTDGRHRAIDLIGEVETIDIHCPQLRPIVAAALDIRDEGGEPNIASILDRLETNGTLAEATIHAGVGFFESLMNATPAIWHMETWTRIILDASRQRDAAAKLKQLKQSVDKNPEHAIRTAERLIETLKGAKRIRPQEALILTRMSDVEEQPITWLWPNRFPRGKSAILQGDPGLGKSLVLGDMTSRASLGADWPDGSRNENGPGSVIIITCEDDPADTIKPRLRRAGADMSKIHVLETAMTFNAKSGRLEHEPFDIGKHIPLLMDAVKRIGDVVLIIVDPITAYTGKVDSHKASEVRGMMNEFLAMIQQMNICLIGIMHQNKQVGGKSVYRASGSLAFVAVSRAVWMIAQDHEDDRRRLMLPVKCNIARRLDGMAYRIESDGEGLPPFVNWEANPVQLTADGYLAQEGHGDKKDEQDSALAKAEEFLREQLKAGPVLSKELEDTVRANYIAPATYKRARESLHCRAEKTGKVWWTLLPGQKRPVAKSGQESQPLATDNLDALDTVEPLETHKQGNQEYQ